MAEVGGMLAAGVLKAAAGKVAAAAGDRIVLQWRFGEDLEDMSDTLESIEAVMQDAERQSIADASVRLWLKRLTRASYDISDMFDELEVNKTRKSALRKFKLLNTCLQLGPEVAMASTVKKLREKLENISNDHKRFSFTAVGNSNGQQLIDKRTTSSEVIEANILGRSEEKREVTDLLTSVSTTSEFIILPIYGIGGMGKTTLAQLLFNDTHFNDYVRAWVYVGQTFDLRKIKDSINTQLSNAQVPDAGSPSRKIMMVLDDLWENNESNLDGLKDFLRTMRNVCKVNVIVTTRDASIAQKIQTIEAHKIQDLSDDVCWDIIKQIVGFEDKDEADKERLEDIGKKIAKMCKGVALAARTLGYMLRLRNYDGWVSVHDSDIWNLSSYDNVLASLKLSYSSMPPNLRQCFGYCAIFPKGHKIEKDGLIYQLAALGLIKPSEDISTWQHGENCNKQLLDMSFFEHSKSSSSMGQHGKDVSFFIMHDLVHDLARSIMGDGVLDASKKFNFGGNNCRYAFLADCSKPLNSFVTYPYKIRALRFLRSGEIGHCHIRFSTAKYLRVLDLGECSLKKLPSSIGQLKLLGYLNAPGIKDRVIPSCIAKLSKLIYFSLCGSSAISALPESIGEMEGLMYLDLSGCSEIRELPKSFGNLASLVHLDMSNCSHIRDLSESLGNLTQLQFLNLSGCTLLEALPRSFGKLKKLVHLNLSNCSQIIDIPGALRRLTKLQYLNLSQTWSHSEDQTVLPEGQWDVIGELIELRYLNLSGCGIASFEHCDGFLDSVNALSNLEHLDLSYNTKLTVIHHRFCRLRNLHTLDLTGCEHLRRLPENISDMNNLKFLIVKGCYRLDMFNLQIMNNGWISLPRFAVYADEGEQSSNLVRLKDATPPELEISQLENVKTVEETGRIQLRAKTTMVDLTLEWTKGKRRFVEDMKLLTLLQPPANLNIFNLRGYNGASLPAWLERINNFLPNLIQVSLEDLPQCSSLPPLGQLPNLKKLELEAMPCITKIDRRFCGGMKAFTQLKEFSISSMKSLEQWSVTYSYNEGVPDEFMFPNLEKLTIRGCPKLRVRPCPPRVKTIWHIRDSDNVLSQWGECAPHTGCSSSALVPTLSLYYCIAPMHQWKLLDHLPGLNELIIRKCDDLSSTPQITRVLCSLRQLQLVHCDSLTSLPQWLEDLTSLQSLSLSYCSGIRALPERLGHLASLRKLSITSCEGIESFPESIQQLTNLESLTVRHCTKLLRRCEAMENRETIGHIIEIDFQD